VSSSGGGHSTPSLKFTKLKAALRTIPSSWAGASYTGYNFITDAESATASEIAVFGVKPGGKHRPKAPITFLRLVQTLSNWSTRLLGLTDPVRTRRRGPPATRLLAVIALHAG